MPSLIQKLMTLRPSQAPSPRPVAPANEARKRCASCRHFDNSPAALEAAFPGLDAMMSAYASVRGSDGICKFHSIYLPASDVCEYYAAKAVSPRAASPS